jgi:hypothetical protein
MRANPLLFGRVAALAKTRYLSVYIYFFIEILLVSAYYRDIDCDS